MTCRNACRLSALICGPLISAVAARGDQVVIAGQSHLGATVVGYEDGRLKFQTADGRMQASWLDEVDLLIVDRGGALGDFNQAERYLSGGEPEKAAIRYERAARLSGEFWPELALTRLITAYDRVAQIDKATLCFVRTARGKHGGPKAAARVMPSRMPEKRDSKVVRALEQLDTALSQGAAEPARVLLELLRFDILRRFEDSRAVRLVPSVALLTIPEGLHTGPVYRVLAEALGTALRSDPTVDRLTALDRAIRDCPNESLSALLLLKGEALAQLAKTHKDWLRASWPYLRVAAHEEGSAEGAEGLIGGARALEEAGRIDYATRLLEEVAENPQAQEQTKRAAAKSLERLKKSEGGK